MLDGGGCTFHVVVLWVQPEVAQQLASHVDGEVLIERVGIPGNRLTAAPARPAPPGLEPAFTTPRALSPGEQQVWAAAFAHGFASGYKRSLAARLASIAVSELRRIDGEDIKEVTTDLSAPECLAHIEQMRGSR